MVCLLELSDRQAKINDQCRGKGVAIYIPQGQGRRNVEVQHFAQPPAKDMANSDCDCMDTGAEDGCMDVGAKTWRGTWLANVI